MPNSLLKKVFLVFMRINKVNSSIVVSKDTFAEITDVAGCFKSGENYTVYERDKKGNIESQIVPTELEAYCCLASKFGLDFYGWIINNYSEELGMKGPHM